MIGGRRTTPDGGVIAVVGASGAVGRATARHLAASGGGPLRLGARRPAENGTPVTRLDVDDTAALHDFCSGAAVVANCAGPSTVVGDRVARVALAVGAHYVDPAGDDRLADLITPLTAGTDRCAVLSAGMMPGLSGVLPRYLIATTPTPVHRLTGHVGGRDHFSPAGAADYLRAEEFGTAHVEWHAGRLVPSAPTGRAVTVPFFPEPVLSMPFLSTEAARIAAAAGLTEVRWHSAFVDGQVAALLRGAASPERPTGEALRRAARLDLFGRTPYQVIVVEVGGADGSARSVALWGRGASELTGAMVAHCAILLRDEGGPPGTHHAADLLDPVTTVTALRQADAVTRIVEVDSTDGLHWREGTL
ncbi:NAD-dependent epimerase/dehydratase family protein [Micromonospora sp. CP22]|uniref:NAD-dependent epimerase/dehydratase family protein n=1 Tax=Micromonospora sp. CP22 TaxID=2580517 RepID=UPI0012BC0DFE|nr:NAD-dependent epimerase/dehydratase family protein [Micromonospora sp. CP22]MTK01476.1 NAD-dependent epimerase/dehydratase family protein [Micromonospora sp. CP22]